MLLAYWTPQWLALDTVFRAIAAKRRRALLYRLLAGPERQPVVLDELINFVALWETLEEPRMQAPGSDGHRADVAVSLLHRHLPYLAAQAIIDYDPQNDTVIVTDRVRDLEPILAVTRHTEHTSEAHR